MVSFFRTEPLKAVRNKNRWLCSIPIRLRLTREPYKNIGICFKCGNLAGLKTQVLYFRAEPNRVYALLFLK